MKHVFVVETEHEIPTGPGVPTKVQLARMSLERILSKFPSGVKPTVESSVNQSNKGKLIIPNDNKPTINELFQEYRVLGGMVYEDLNPTQDELLYVISVIASRPTEITRWSDLVLEYRAK